VPRVIVDANVFVAALLAPRGACARVLLRWADGRYELLVSPLLLAEIERVLRRPKFAGFISPAEIDGLLDALREDATLHNDPSPQSGLTRDPNDDYLVALALATHADCIVSGDNDLLDLEGLDVPVMTPRAYLERT
jgi:putative PIN family toxin of toxin-antitoxin system